jgi:hypothetical protein
MNGIHVSQGQSSFIWRRLTFGSTKHQQNDRKFRKISRLFNVNLFLLTLRSTVTFWDAWEEMCDQRNRNFGATTTAPSSQCARPHVPETTEFVTNNMVIVSHHPYLPDLALFPNLKMKLKGWRFETVSDIQRESQAILNSIKQMTSTVPLTRGKNDGIAVYVPQETILK